MPKTQAAPRKSPVPLEATMVAIASPRRRQILRLVWSAERSAGEIAATVHDVSWPAVSQNLRVLKNSGLITERRQGTHRYYKADRRALGPPAVAPRQMGAPDPGPLRGAREAESGYSRAPHE